MFASGIIGTPKGQTDNKNNNNPLLSPSKARQAARLAQSRATAHSWLTRLYAPGAVPPYERDHESAASSGGGNDGLGDDSSNSNTSVLAQVLTLAAANADADAGVDVLGKAWEEELARLLEKEKGVERDKGGGGGGRSQSYVEELMVKLEAGLDDEAHKALEELAEGWVAWGTLQPGIGDDGEVEADDHQDAIVAMGENVTQNLVDEFELQEQNRRAVALQAYLEREMITLQGEIERVKKTEDEAESEHLRLRTAQWNREAKQVSMKIAEYKDRIAGLEKVKTILTTTIEQVKEEETVALDLQEKVRLLERRVLEFHDLPPDLEASMTELTRSQEELQALIRKRDELFERLVES